jgi:SAM-dependent methyltransferase
LNDSFQIHVTQASETGMAKSDIDNLMLADTVESVDHLNARFYSQFPYPWQALKFDYLQDPYFETVMLNQDVGAWQCDVIPRDPKIWIAGCGTNQAVFTALRFPNARVIGSDVSTASLEICAHTAKQLDISNLELRNESINDSAYMEEFDFIISTGVIHHNADPQATLNKISSALKPSGILELMVYNRFHLANAAAFQKAVRILNRDGATVDFESGLTVAKAIIEEVSQETTTGVISGHREYSDAMLADELLQPVLHSYTVESLADLAESCRLEILLPCLNHLDRAEQRTSWHMDFGNSMLREMYESLPDLRRWQVTNLLRREASPQLWFYLQRKDSRHKRKSEREICEEFLANRFARAETTQRGYIQTDDGNYRLVPNSIPFPSTTPDKSVRRIFEATTPGRSLKDVLGELGIAESFPIVNSVRILLTTSAFPYLRAMPNQGS